MNVNLHSRHLLLAVVVDLLAVLAVTLFVVTALL